MGDELAMSFADEELKTSVDHACDAFTRRQSQVPFDELITPRLTTDVTPMVGFIRFLEAEGVNATFIESLAGYGKAFIENRDMSDYVSREEYAYMLKVKKKGESPAAKQEKLAKLEAARKKRSEELGIGKVAQQETLVSFLMFLLSIS
jgi:hypothetical protein